MSQGQSFEDGRDRGHWEASAHIIILSLGLLLGRSFCAHSGGLFVEVVDIGRPLAPLGRKPTRVLFAISLFTIKMLDV